MIRNKAPLEVPQKLRAPFCYRRFLFKNYQDDNEYVSPRLLTNDLSGRSSGSKFHNRMSLNFLWCEVL